MNKPYYPPQKFTAILMAVSLAFPVIAPAQESAYADLNECTKKEQINATVKGAAVGALAGLGAAFLSGKKDKAPQAAVVGAVVGGAAGFAVAYYNSIQTCYKLNPSWIPESQLERDPQKSYAQIIEEYKYQPSEGIKVKAKNINMPDSIKSGATLDITTTYDLMTPDGAEAPILVDRKLFSVTDGQETALSFPGKTSEERMVAPGRSKDTVKLSIPKEAKPGEIYRVEFTVSSQGKNPSVISKSTKVK